MKSHTVSGRSQLQLRRQSHHNRAYEELIQLMFFKHRTCVRYVLMML